MVAIIIIETPTLGDRSYLAHDGGIAFVVDPQRDIDRILEKASTAGVQITHVLETHIHNDYVTGGLALAQATGAQYLVNGADEVSFERTPIAGGQRIAISPTMTLDVLATPGHTLTHLSYVLTSGGRTIGVFTGGSLLFGSTGRPDLLGPEHTHELAHQQYGSAQLIAAAVPDDTQLLPTHGFGSFCSTAISHATASTVGAERLANPVLTQDEEDYVREMLAGLDAYPAYYAHMGARNLAGPKPADLAEPSQADAAQLLARIQAGEWVVDLRHRTAFAAGHAVGTLNFGLDGSFATYLGWLIPWGTPVTLLGETPDDVARAQRELVRIGVDRPAAASTGGPGQWSDAPLASYLRADFTDLANVRHHREVAVLDVRRRGEWTERHIEGALNIPLHDVPARLDGLPPGELWVHCASGYRASIVTSMLAARGRAVVLIDDHFSHAAKAGLPMVGRA
ncbi:MBL fold metallo-hydrolase [Arthrobacter sp. 35W]|uniref:MBL fold metallo-hydrolase n=1 Tax=Arthrobacter sp. 35W TaxID=1132441 RepID=UPI000428CB6F|nr:MBL fold metallo-hydrolase [Arthrobacter sp. 35W]